MRAAPAPAALHDFPGFFLERIGQRNRPIGTPSSATKTAVWPCSCRSPASHARTRVDALEAQQRLVAHQHLAQLHDASGARPGKRLETVAAARAAGRGPAPRARSPGRADARSPAPGSPRCAEFRLRHALHRDHRRPLRAGPASACRSCRARRCRPRPAARAPRRCGTAARPARHGPWRRSSTWRGEPSAQGQAMISAQTATTSA